MNTSKISYFTVLKNGSIPFVNENNFQLHCAQSHNFSLNLASILNSKIIFDNSLDLECVINSIYPNKEPFILSYTDVSDPNFSDYYKYCRKKDIPILTSGGFSHLQAERFHNIIDKLKPKYIQIPAISIPPGLNTAKYRKAVDKSINFIKDLSKVCDFNNYNFIGTIVGGGSPENMHRCAEAVLNFPLSGFIIDDYKNLDPLLLKSIISILPSGKPRIVFDSIDFNEIIEAVKLGITVFTDSFVIECVSRKLILNRFNFNHPSVLYYNISESKKTNEPLVEDCSCYTCKNYKTAYIRHLTDVKEMLADILIYIHNFNIFKEFFEELNK